MQLKISDLSLTLGGRQILQAINLAMETGEALALVGPSGAGKTTLVRAILGLQPTAAGKITINGQDLRRLSGRERASRLGWLPQMGMVAEPIAVADLVAAARFRFDELRPTTLAAVGAALASCGIARLGSQAVNTLAGGELQRVAVAALVAQDPETFLLDEPSNHLDVRRQRDLYRLLGDEWRGGRGLMVITHDVNLLAALGGQEDQARIRVVGMRQGSLRWEMPYDDPALPEALQDLLELRLHAVEVEGQRFIIAGGTP
jgi:iron complex transport system ATP-binding protein